MQNKTVTLIVLGIALIGMGIVGFYVEYQEFRSLGESPRTMTIAEAMPADERGIDETRWVRLSEPLVPDCSSALDRTVNGRTIGTLLLASDAAKTRWVSLNIHGQPPCGAAMESLQGIFKKADPGLPEWLKGKGVTVPASTYPLMEMAVGETPGNIKLLLGSFAGMALLGVICLATGMISRRGRRRTPQRISSSTLPRRAPSNASSPPRPRS